jgi:hypothetical protein
MEFKPITFTSEYIQKFWDGPTNRLARYYTYLQRGLSIFNEAKNYLLLLFGSYWTIRTMDLWIKLGYSDTALIIGVTICAIVGTVILIFLGRWELRKLSKTKDYAITTQGSVVGYDSYNMQVKQIELLENILKEMKGGKNETIRRRSI